MKAKPSFTQLGLGAVSEPNVLPTSFLEIRKNGLFLLEKSSGQIILNNGKKFNIDRNVWQFFEKPSSTEIYFKSVGANGEVSVMNPMGNVGKISVFKNLRKLAIPKGFLRIFDLGQLKDCLLVENTRDGYKLGLVLPVWTGIEIKKGLKGAEKTFEIGNFFVKNWDVTPGQKPDSAGGFIDPNQLLNKYAFETYIGNRELFNAMAFATERKFKGTDENSVGGSLSSHEIINEKNVKEFVNSLKTVIDGELVYWQALTKSKTEIEYKVLPGTSEHILNFCGGNQINIDNPAYALEHNGKHKIFSTKSLPGANGSVRILTEDTEEKHNSLMRLPSTKILKGAFQWQGDKLLVKSLRTEKRDDGGIDGLILSHGVEGLRSKRKSKLAKISGVEIDPQGGVKITPFGISMEDNYVMYTGAYVSPNKTKCLLGYDFENNKTEILRRITYRKTGNLPGGVLGSLLAKNNVGYFTKNLIFLKEDGSLIGKSEQQMNSVTDTFDSISYAGDLSDGYFAVLDNRGYERRFGSNQAKMVEIFDKNSNKSYSIQVDDFVEHEGKLHFIKKIGTGIKKYEFLKTENYTVKRFLEYIEDNTGAVPYDTGIDGFYRYEPKLLKYSGKIALAAIVGNDKKKVFELAELDAHGFKKIIKQYDFPDNFEILGFAKYGSPDNADFRFGLKKIEGNKTEEGYALLENMELKNISRLPEGWFIPGNKIIDYAGPSLFTIRN